MLFNVKAKFSCSDSELVYNYEESPLCQHLNAPTTPETQQTDDGRDKQVSRQKENHILKTSRVHRVKGHGLLATPRGL